MKIIHDPEQVTNDLEKCFKTLLKCESGEITDNVFKAKNLIVIGALEGRFDHVCCGACLTHFPFLSHVGNAKYQRSFEDANTFYCRS